MKVYESDKLIKPFPCPQCREYLATDVLACRFCGLEIEDGFADAAARREKLLNRVYRKKHYSKHLWQGSGLLALGVAIMIVSYFLAQEILHTNFVWVPRALILGGGGDFLYGIYGLMTETRSAKSEIL